MRKADSSMFLDGHRVPLMTADEVFPGAEMGVADFRDTHAIWYRKPSCWVALGPDGLTLGSGAPELVDGVWYVELDRMKNSFYESHAPDIGELELRRIG